MKDVIKYTIGTGAGIVIGFGIGYTLANHKAIKLIDETFNEMSERYEANLAAIRAEYEDQLSRSFKIGPYSTVADAANTLIQDESESVFVSTDMANLHVPDDASDEEEEFEDEDDEEEDDPDHGFEPEPDDFPEDILANYRHRIDEYGAVTFPGGDSDEKSTEEESYDDTPEPSVPEFKTVRDPNGPYLISIDEYMDDVESPFTKVEMTYFEGDDTLVDADDKMVPDIAGIVGRKNLDRWGEGTTDPNQVYIRNERIEIDIELTRDENTYTRAILGIVAADELKRQQTKPLRMRAGDDD